MLMSMVQRIHSDTLSFYVNLRVKYYTDAYKLILGYHESVVLFDLLSKKNAEEPVFQFTFCIFIEFYL